MTEPQPQPAQQTFKQYTKDQEMRVRGLYLMIAVDTDWMLSSIIAKVTHGKPETEFVRLLRQADVQKKKELHQLTLDNKIQMTRVCLREYYPDQWTKHENDLQECDKIRNYRNDLAHGKIEWDEVNEDGSKLDISILTARGIETTTHNRSALVNNLIAYMANMKSLLETINNELVPPEERKDLTPKL